MQVDKKEVLKSWISYEATDNFPIQNLPFGVAKNPNTQKVSCYSRISSIAINLSVLENHGLLDTDKFKFNKNVFNQNTLNTFMELGKDVRNQVREKLTEIFSDKKYYNDKTIEESMEKISTLEMRLPCNIPDYTDFYSSKNHAWNIGSLFRPNMPLQPNWTHIPVGYHGRSSSIVVHDTKVRRPRGQVKKAPTIDEPIFSECKKLDYEIEMGVILGRSNPMGTPIKVNEAPNYIFGFVLLNDWSARDLQAWEYVPLGPFTAKNFASTISAWIITPEALEPFKVTLPEQDPKPLKYLEEKHHYSYDIPISVEIKGKNQKEGTVVGQTNYRHMYWTAAQQIAHHSVSGCNLSVGDLYGSGTISGTDDLSLGCLLESSKGGKQKIKLNDEERVFLEDGDYVLMKASCKGEGYNIGFSDCGGEVLPTLDEKEYY